MASSDATPSRGPAMQETNFDSLRRDEESLTGVDVNNGPESNTGSNGHAYGTVGGHPSSSSSPSLPSSSSSSSPPSQLPPPTPGPKPNNGATPEPDTPEPSRPARALAPDLLRGLLMIFMAMDHNVVGLSPWPHSTNASGIESDTSPVERWNSPLGYTIRTLSHLCAPGFTFLMGMGVVYFGRSRAKLGWTAARMARHFAVRGAVLTAVSTVMGFVLTRGQIWFFNIVLVALAVDYVLVGLLWLAVEATEPALAKALDRFVLREDGRSGGERTPLLEHAGFHTPCDDDNNTKPSVRAERISWHVHNMLLLVLAFVTIWWNHWLSPAHGACTAAAAASPSTASDFWRFWFFMIEKPGVISGFPPLAWLSFAILGQLYARIVLARPAATAVRAANLAAGLVFTLLFVLTRLLRIGNLSEGCLRTPDQDASPPGANPYLASPASFFYIVKYPPDFAFFSFTLAANLFLLALFAAVPPRLAKRGVGSVLLAFGSSVLFFYLVHMVVVFSLCMVLVQLFGHDTGVPPPPPPPSDGRPSRGVDNVWLWWANWALVMGIMYPLCRRYSAFKKTRDADSVWRFF